MSRMSTDVQDVEWSIMSVLEAAFREPITIILTLTFMFIFNAKLSIFVLIVLPLAAIIIGQIGKTL